MPGLMQIFCTTPGVLNVPKHKFQNIAHAKNVFIFIENFILRGISYPKRADICGYSLPYSNTKKNENNTHSTWIELKGKAMFYISLSGCCCFFHHLNFHLGIHKNTYVAIGNNQKTYVWFSSILNISNRVRAEWRSTKVHSTVWASLELDITQPNPKHCWTFHIWET